MRRAVSRARRPATAEVWRKLRRESGEFAGLLGLVISGSPERGDVLLVGVKKHWRASAKSSAGQASGTRAVQAGASPGMV